MGLPNIRRNFLPDPGKFIFDSDLDSADLRIVTWESDCTEMKAMFREGKKPYVEVVAGIHNIFKIFHIEYVRRLTYVGPDTQKWGVRGMFRLTF